MSETPAHLHPGNRARLFVSYRERVDFDETVTMIGDYAYGLQGVDVLVRREDGSSMAVRVDQLRPVDEPSPREYREILDACRDLDPDAYALLLGEDAGPGRYEGEPRPVLTAAVDFLAVAGMADDTAGHVDYGRGHAARVGRFVVWCGPTGFRTLEVFATEEEAVRTMEETDAATADMEA